jgi:hypothetical protein
MRLFRSICCLFAAAFTLAWTVDGRAAGAFAVGNCGAYGFAYDYPLAMQATAKQDATKQCSGVCQTIEVTRACAAFAVDAANACGAYGYATASKLGAAQNTAMKQCHGHGGKDCMIRAWICDTKG